MDTKTYQNKTNASEALVSTDQSKWGEQISEWRNGSQGTRQSHWGLAELEAWSKSAVQDRNKGELSTQVTFLGSMLQ